MENIRHPFIAKFEFAFLSVIIFIKKNYLVFGLEFCPGGDLFTHLK